MLMKRKYYKRKKRGPVVSKKVEYDGITFASGLEKYMYIALKAANIPEEDVQRDVTVIMPPLDLFAKTK